MPAFRKVIVITVLILLVTALLILILTKIQDKKEQQLQLSFLPHICMKTIDAEDYYLSDISKERPIILLFMNLDCGDCINSLLMVINDENIIKSCSTILILSSISPQLTDFIEKYNLLEKVKILIDSEDICFKEFQISGTPTTFIYNKEHVFDKKIEGEFSITTLNKYLRKQTI